MLDVLYAQAWLDSERLVGEVFESLNALELPEDCQNAFTSPGNLIASFKKDRAYWCVSHDKYYQAAARTVRKV